MIRKTILTGMLVALAAATAPAQDARVELSGTAGWTFSDGVNVGAIDDSPIRVDPKDAFSWGARIGFNVTPNVEIGGLFGMQSTDLEASGIVNLSTGRRSITTTGTSLTTSATRTRRPGPTSWAAWARRSTAASTPPRATSAARPSSRRPGPPA